MESRIGVWLPGVLNANFFRRKTPWIGTNNFRKFEYIHVVVAVSAFETFLYDLIRLAVLPCTFG